MSLQERAGKIPEEARPATGPFARFLEAFFQERSILWLLATGVLILLGSSLFLVTSHWQEITPAWKCVVLFICTAAIHGAGHVASCRIGVRRTGTVLLGLTVLLIPVNFLALHWLQTANGARTGPTDLHWPLFALNASFAWLAAGRVFRHFLRGSQPTFLASYLVLTAAGSLAPALPTAWAPWTALFLWSVLAVGCLKVNRHVFWLVEAHRKPRIFGFFPVMVLGAQFVAVFVIHLAGGIEPHWLGLGCVLAALPGLLAADALARVFEMRTGGVVRPLPASIAAPLVIGILLCASGLCLSSVNLFTPARDALALVPSAALAAAIMALAARRTRKEALAWAALVCATLAYNFSPAFFRELALRAASACAGALREERLPYAFYGLTYLPLLAVLGTLGARWRTECELFARPMRRFAAGLASALVLASWSHPKALLPVGGALGAFLGVEAFLLGDRRLFVPALLGLLTAAAGVWPFALRVLGLEASPWLVPLSLAALAALFAVAGSRLDRTAGAWPLRRGEERLSPLLRGFAALPLAALSLFTAGIAALAWASCAAIEAPDAMGIPAALIIALLLAAHAPRWRLPLLGMAAAMFPVFALGSALAWSGWSLPETLNVLVLVLVVMWGGGVAAAGRAPEGIATGLAIPAARASAFVLGAALVTAYLGLFALEMAGGLGGLEPRGFVSTLGGLASSLAIVAWAFIAARRSNRRALTVLGAIGAMGLAGAVLKARFGMTDLEWLPLAWTAMAIAALPARRLAPGLGETLLSIFSLSLAASLVRISWPLSAAGLAAAGGLWILAARERRRDLRCLVWVLADCQVICMVLQAFAGGPLTVLDLLRPPLAAALPLAFAASLSLAVFQRLAPRAPTALAGVFLCHRIALRIAAGAALAASLSAAALSAVAVVLASASFSLLVASELRRACERAGALRVWSAEAIAGAAIAYLVYMGVIELGHGISLYALAGAAFLFHGLASLARRKERWLVLVEPFRRTALMLPAAALMAAVLRHALGDPAIWLGARSLAILLGAAFYFWRGIEERRRGLIVAAVAVANAALILLWRELRWTDPQLYLVPAGVTILALVEVLRSEIPERWHDPLRYAGALVVLVSPVFHIVDGSWIHLLSLMLLSSCLILVSIGIRVRASLYAGMAFLAADLAAMVVVRSLDDKDILWIAGLGLGGLIIGLAALCENRREALQGKVRALAARLELWS